MNEIELVPPADCVRGMYLSMNMINPCERACFLYD